MDLTPPVLEGGSLIFFSRILRTRSRGWPCYRRRPAQQISGPTRPPHMWARPAWMRTPGETARRATALLGIPPAVASTGRGAPEAHRRRQQHHQTNAGRSERRKKEESKHDGKRLEEEAAGPIFPDLSTAANAQMDPAPLVLLSCCPEQDPRLTKDHQVVAAALLPANQGSVLGVLCCRATSPIRPLRYAQLCFYIITEGLGE
ncbi:uncharacterized protein [Melanerpes formicivorus]|uniref:uncharacterized protein n=1 Tax=Melanerpes formicivorus TaxID=211600 RepID=UPI00358E6954